MMVCYILKMIYTDMIKNKKGQEDNFCFIKDVTTLYYNKYLLYT